MKEKLVNIGFLQRDKDMKKLRRRADHLNGRASLSLGDGQKLFLGASPPYAVPNPRNPALTLDKTVIYP